MKFNRRQFTPRIISDNGKSLFSFLPILGNIITIAALAYMYWFVVQKNFYAEYQVYLYWTVNVLISYNIIAASARSFLAPIITLAVGLGFLFASMFYGLNFVTHAEYWQIIVLGVVGFLITVILKL